MQLPILCAGKGNRQSQEVSCPDLPALGRWLYQLHTINLRVDLSSGFCRMLFAEFQKLGSYLVLKATGLQQHNLGPAEACPRLE